MNTWWKSSYDGQMVNPKVFLEKLINSLFDENESLQWNNKRKNKFLKQHCPSETLVEALQATEVIQPLRPNCVDSVTYDRCICGHQKADGQHPAEEKAWFGLRDIQKKDDTINTMLVEEFNKIILVPCENCGEDIRCTTERKLIDHPYGFVASINRAKMVPSGRFNRDGTPKMVGVSDKCHF